MSNHTSFHPTSDASSSSATAEPIYTPSPTPTATPQRSTATSTVGGNTPKSHPNDLVNAREMDNSPAKEPTDHETEPQTLPQTLHTTAPDPSTSDVKKASNKKKKCSHRRKHHSSKKSKKVGKLNSESDSESSSSDSDAGASTIDSDDDTSDDEATRKKARRRKQLKKRQKQKSKSKRKQRVVESDSSDDEDDDESSSSDSSSEEEQTKRRRRKKGKARRHEAVIEEDALDEESAPDEIDENAQLRARLAALEAGIRRGRGGRRGLTLHYQDQDLENMRTKARRKKRKPAKRASTLEYKRIDQLWDNSIHNYKLTESAEDQEDEFDQYVFTVRRKFDWENKYKNTVVDIKSKLLRDALAEILKDVKGVSLVEDKPSIDPNMLFLYLEELRTHAKKTLKARAKAEKKRKAQKVIKTTIAECKVLVSYLDEDYEETKKILYPMLAAGNITFDLLWALFKPNSVAFTTTYGSVDDPRCYKVDYASKESSFMRGEWYSVEGRYLEYDGKSFGLGDFEVTVDAFKGPRKITSLATYPLQYHRDSEGVKKQLIERGKRFVAMEGMNYLFHKGLAFMKKKKTIAKVNINGRVMIDPAIFRRINPNYPISLIKAKDPEDLFGGDDDDEDCSSCCDCDDSDDEQPDGAEGPVTLEQAEKTKFKVVMDKDKNMHVVEVRVDEDGQEIVPENIDKLDNKHADATEEETTKREFTEEELLIASPVVLGFAFSEKLWLEFSLSGICPIEWNEGAFESLVLPNNQKSIVKALVESHKFHAAKTIDDVVQGKGKGLVAVLHGPPGTGKTLTAEGIAELLRCPLYMVSAGELGTDPRMLEHELQKILDIAHSWGAVLLLDEADVFLEKREVHDIHRNALVSIFLRLLEYFQGILFLTTNRVETFDDAFQSRIHVALRYGELTTKAKKAVWKMFLEKVRDMEGVATYTFDDSDYNMLARHTMNGRQIKNAVRTAQALAVNEQKKLNMDHIKRVLEVAQSFENDLKGGTGYMDAMRSYT